MTEIYLNAKRYRLNVGAVVFNRDGKVWLGRRADGKGEQIWQFPQGGVDGDEDLLDAARRELWEETGIRSASLIARAPGWITYDFPEGFTGSKAMKGYAGQTQAWFAFRFEGEDAEIDLNAHHQVEFDQWRWADLNEAPDQVVAFKHDAYLKVVEAFSPIATAGMDSTAPVKDARGAMLMIHGVGCTGKVWARMAADFRGRGWTVRAPTLHETLRVKTNPASALQALSFADYVDEAEGWARSLEAESGAPVVLVGHSMGGLIVQKLLERGVGRAGVLITPASPADVQSVSLSTAVVAANVLMVAKPEQHALKFWRSGVRWGMFNRLAKVRHDALYDDMVYDSGKMLQAVGRPEQDPTRSSAVDESKITTPMLTIGAKQDRTTPERGVRAVAAKYAKVGGEYRVYPDHAHWIIDEPGSDQVVADIDAWLRAKLA